MQIHHIVIWICSAIWFSICNIHRDHTYLHNFALRIAFVSMSINMFLLDFYVDRITFRIHHSIDDNEFWNVLIDICVNFIAIFIRLWKCKRLKQFCVLLLSLFLMSIFKIRWIFFLIVYFSSKHSWQCFIDSSNHYKVSRFTSHEHCCKRFLKWQS